MVNISADHVAMMLGCWSGENKNRHTHWPDMPVDPVQQYPAFLLVWCNCNMHYCWCDVANTNDCWPRVSLKGVCAGSVPHYQTRVMLRMSDMMSLWYYVAAVQ